LYPLTKYAYNQTMLTELKKIAFTASVGLAVFCLQPITTNAQSSTVPVNYPKNLVKINLGALLALKSYSFNYERMLTKKISFMAGYNTLPESKLSDMPLIKKVSDKLLEDGDPIKDDFDRIKVSNTAYTAEFRFYSGSNPGARGFYISLYGRYANTKSDYQYIYETNAKTYQLPIKADIKGFGGGILMGTQYIIAKRVALDFYVGGHYGKSNGDANAIADLSSMSTQEKADLQADLESLVEIRGKQYLKATVTNDGVMAKVNGPFIGLRAGASIGIAF
jgi:hypothetical protein